MTKAASLHQAEKFLGEIGGVVSSSLKHLRNQQDLCALLHPINIVDCQVASNKSLVNAVDFSIGSQHVFRTIKFTTFKRDPQLFQHLFQDSKHRCQMPHIASR